MYKNNERNDKNKSFTTAIQSHKIDSISFSSHRQHSRGHITTSCYNARTYHHFLLQCQDISPLPVTMPGHIITSCYNARTYHHFLLQCQDISPLPYTMPGHITTSCCNA